MIGLDTYVLVRYLTRDDPRQAESARKFIDRASAEGTMLFISHVVLCELAWVLKASYRHSREEVSDVIEGILFTRQFEIEEKDVALQSLQIYRTSKGGLADCLIGVKNRAAGCENTVTFDRAAGSSELFRVLK